MGNRAGSTTHSRTLQQTNDFVGTSFSTQLSFRSKSGLHYPQVSGKPTLTTDMNEYHSNTFFE